MVISLYALTYLMSSFEFVLSLILLDLMHLRLNTFENLLQFVCFQWNDLVVIGDLLHAFDLVAFGLRLGAGDLVLKVFLVRISVNHAREDLISVCLHTSCLKGKGTLSE